MMEIDEYERFQEAKKKFNIDYFKNLPENKKNDKKFILDYMNTTCVSILQYLNNELRSDKEIVETSLFYEENDLQFVSEPLKSNNEFMKRMIKIHPMALKYLSNDLKNDKNLIMDVINGHGGNILAFAGENIRNDKEIILLALRIDSWPKGRNNYEGSNCYLHYLEYLGENLKSDEEFLLSLIKFDGRVLYYASDSLKNNREFILTAYKVNSTSIKYVGKELLYNDKEIIKLAVNSDCSLFKYANKDLKQDKNFISEIIFPTGDNNKIMKFVDEKLKDDKEFMMQLMKKRNVAKYLSERLKMDVDIAILAAQTNGFWEMSEKLRRNKEVMIYILTHVNCITSEVLKYASDELKNDKKFILKSFKRFSPEIVLKNASEELRKDKDINIAAIKEGLEVFYIDEKYKNDPDILLAIDNLNRNYQRYLQSLEEIKDSTSNSSDNFNLGGMGSM